MRQKPFETVVLMHSLFLPFDMVNGLAGYLKLDWKPFLLGAVLGSFPGMIACVLFGASVKGALIRGVPLIRPLNLALSGFMVAGSLGVAYALRRGIEKDMLISPGVAQVRVQNH